MPNINNIQSPITLIASGRSGTSLISSIFDSCPECAFVGETENLIFDVWDAVDISISGLATQRTTSGELLSTEQRAVNIIQQTFLGLFPDEKLFWMHKPIGIPKKVLAKFEKIDCADEAQSGLITTWYWDIFRLTFPNGKFFTVLRHPCDVILSSVEYWGIREEDAWFRLGVLSLLLNHKNSLISYALHYDELLKSPENTVGKLFNFSGVLSKPDLPSILKKVHAPSSKRATIDQLTSRIIERNKLDQTKITKFQQELITSTYLSFGYKVEWPKHFNKIHSMSSPSSTSMKLSRAKSSLQHAKVVSELKDSIEKLNLDFSKRLSIRNQEASKQVETLLSEIIKLGNSNLLLSEQIVKYERDLDNGNAQLGKLEERVTQLNMENYDLEQKLILWQAKMIDIEIKLDGLISWNTELEKGKSWLEYQVVNWQNHASALEKQIDELKNWNSELEKGKSWLEQQVINWQDLDSALEKQMDELKNWNSELEKGKSWLEQQVINWQDLDSDLEKQINELKSWNNELEMNKKYLEKKVFELTDCVAILEKRSTLRGFLKQKIGRLLKSIRLA